VHGYSNPSIQYADVCRTSEQREYLFRQFKGKCEEMMRHTYAALILEYAYNDYANAQQRFMIVREFYGQQFTLATMVGSPFLPPLVLPSPPVDGRTSRPDKRTLAAKYANPRE